MNDIFAEHAWYFRNALVRANYTNLKKWVHETTEYLELFLRNLLLGESNPVLPFKAIEVAFRWPLLLYISSHLMRNAKHLMKMQLFCKSYKSFSCAGFAP